MVAYGGDGLWVDKTFERLFGKIVFERVGRVNRSEQFSVSSASLLLIDIAALT